MGFLFTILGGMLFGPMGALAGSLLGAALFPAKSAMTAAPDPPTSETFSYGVPIKKIWNRYRVGGTRVWQTDINVRRIAGKKHGFFIFTTSQDPDMFQYRASWAVILCQGPAVAVRTIWADGKVIYDVSEYASAEAVANSRALEGGTANKIVICLGDEDQEPIPEMALADPDTDHPAYRDRVTIVFYNWEVTPFGGRIPEINAEVLVNAEVTPDVWDEVGDEVPATMDDGLINAGHCVALGRLWMVGGYQWTGSTIVDCTNALYAVLQDDGTLEWKAGPPLPVGRGEFELVYSPSLAPSLLGDLPEKILVLGGHSFDVETGATYYDSPTEEGRVSGMVLELTYNDKGWYKSWVPQPIIGDRGGITNSRIPFPRESFAAVSFDAPYPWGRGIFVCGGVCKIDYDSTKNLSWIGPYNFLRDLWFYNEGNTWQLLTEISADPETGYEESEDCGCGYRTKASMVVFNDNLYLLGGIGPSDAGARLRDVYKMVFGGLPRFSQTNADIMADWPNEVKKDDYYISGATVWRNSLIVIVSRVTSYTDQIILWKSDDGITFEIYNKGEYAIQNHGTGYYYVAGDHTDDIRAGDTLTAVGTATFDECSITGVSLVTGNTRINVTPTETLASGTLYIHQVANLVTDRRDDIFFKTAGFVNYKENLYLLGGIEPIGDTRQDKIQINKVVNSIAYPETITLQEVVEDLCEVDAGIDLSLIDASQLTDTVQGVCAANRPTVQQVIEQLRQYGFFDGVESDGKLKFAKRGGASLTTITDDYLAVEDASKQEKPETNRPEKLTIAYEQESDLPQSVEVIYADVNNDYLEGSQIAKRSVGDARRVITLNLTIAMDADRAKRIAEINLLEAWVSRAVLNWQTSYRYLPYDPSDVVTLSVDGDAYVTRIKSMDFGTPKIVKFQSVLEEPHIYDDVFLAGLGVSGPTPSRPEILWTDLEITGVLMDIPWIWGEDKTGFQFGAYPTDPAQADRFLGAELWGWESSDHEYGKLASVVEYVDHGTVVGSFNQFNPTEENLGNREWDYETVLQVSMELGELTSADSQVELTTGHVNMLAIGNATIGWEIIQFGVAAYDSVNQIYNLFMLRRGCFGTEQIVHGSPATGELVIVLDPSKFCLAQLSDSAKGVSLDYSVVHKGVDPDYGTKQDFTCNLICKKPFAPWPIYGQRLDTGVWKFFWLWRNRGPGLLWLGIDPLKYPDTFPVDQFTAEYLWREPEKIFEIDFYNADGSAVVYTKRIVLTDKMTTVPQDLFEILDRTEYYQGGIQTIYGQKTVYGAAVSTIKLKIYQVNKIHGRGYGTTIEFPNPLYSWS